MGHSRLNGAGASAADQVALDQQAELHRDHEALKTDILVLEQSLHIWEEPSPLREAQVLAIDERIEGAIAACTTCEPSELRQNQGALMAFREARGIVAEGQHVRERLYEAKAALTLFEADHVLLLGLERDEEADRDGAQKSRGKARSR